MTTEKSVILKALAKANRAAKRADNKAMLWAIENGHGHTARSAIPYPAKLAGELERASNARTEAILAAIRVGIVYQRATTFGERWLLATGRGRNTREYLAASYGTE